MARSLVGPRLAFGAPRVGCGRCADEDADADADADADEALGGAIEETRCLFCEAAFAFASSALAAARRCAIASDASGRLTTSMAKRRRVNIILQ